MLPNVKPRVIPASFAASGFITLQQVVNQRRLLISTEGEPDSGKTEFIFSAPGPGLVTIIDRGIDGIGRNPRPPKARRSDFAVKVMKVRQEVNQAKFNANDQSQNEFLQDFLQVKDSFYSSLDNKDAATAAIDTDSDFWKLQELATFGKISQIPPMMREGLNAARRAIYARAWDAGKIVIATNKLGDEYETVYDASGKPVIDDKGKETRVKTGNRKGQGFNDQGYLWQIKLRHLYEPAGEKRGERWGFRILRCKHDKSCEGLTLWGAEANFAGLVQTVFPDVPLGDWGL